MTSSVPGHFDCHSLTQTPGEGVLLPEIGRLAHPGDRGFEVFGHPESRFQAATIGMHAFGIAELGTDQENLSGPLFIAP